MDKRFILIVGGPVEGFTYYGPFTADDPNLRDLTGMFSLSWCVPLQPTPTTDEDWARLQGGTE